MRKAWIALAALGATLAGGVPLVAQAQEEKTVGGHIGCVLPLVTHAGGQTINDTADQFSIGFPVGITFKGTGRMAFDLEFIPFINTAKPRQTTLTVHPRSYLECGTRLRGGSTIGVRHKRLVVGLYAAGEQNLPVQ